MARLHTRRLQFSIRQSILGKQQLLIRMPNRRMHSTDQSRLLTRRFRKHIQLPPRHRQLFITDQTRQPFINRLPTIQPIRQAIPRPVWPNKKPNRPRECVYEGMLVVASVVHATRELVGQICLPNRLSRPAAIGVGDRSTRSVSAAVLTGVGTLACYTTDFLMAAIRFFSKNVRGDPGVFFVN